MSRPRSAVIAAIAALAMTGALCTGCSVDTVIWGAEGARVIALADDVVDQVIAGAESPRACPLSSPEFGEPQRWLGLSGGEPERLAGDFWKDQRSLGAVWTINLEGLDSTTAENGGRYPSYVFFAETDDDLCVIDIEWGTVTF